MMFAKSRGGPPGFEAEGVLPPAVQVIDRPCCLDRLNAPTIHPADPSSASETAMTGYRTALEGFGVTLIDRGQS